MRPNLRGQCGVSNGMECPARLCSHGRMDDDDDDNCAVISHKYALRDYFSAMMRVAGLAHMCTFG